MCWSGAKGCCGICPNCGGIATCSWDPETDVSTCTVCGWNNAEDVENNYIMEVHIMIDWKKKLTSRKFWMAVVAFITPLLLAFGVAETEVTQVTAIIMAGADVLAYIIAEGMVDAKSAAAAPGNSDLPY